MIIAAGYSDAMTIVARGVGNLVTGQYRGKGGLSLIRTLGIVIPMKPIPLSIVTMNTVLILAGTVSLVVGEGIIARVLGETGNGGDHDLPITDS